MKITIIVADDDGNIFQGETELTAAAREKPGRRHVKRNSDEKTSPRPPVNFSLPIRAFVKTHARAMGGPQKFALLVAYLSKGEAHKQVSLADVQRCWNTMKPLLDGKFNVAYTTRAKEQGWVDSPTRGMYLILPSWKGVFDAR